MLCHESTAYPEVKNFKKKAKQYTFQMAAVCVCVYVHVCARITGKNTNWKVEGRNLNPSLATVLLKAG